MNGVAGFICINIGLFTLRKKIHQHTVKNCKKTMEEVLKPGVSNDSQPVSSCAVSNGDQSKPENIDGINKTLELVSENLRSNESEGKIEQESVQNIVQQVMTETIQVPTSNENTEDVSVNNDAIHGEASEIHFDQTVKESESKGYKSNKLKESP